MTKPSGRPRPKLPILPSAATRWTPDLLLAIAAGERAVLATRLRRHDAAAVIEAAEEASLRAEELRRAALAREPPDRPIACRAGCPSCCAAKVLLTAPEILRIADHLRRTRDAEALADLTERVRKTDERTRGLSREDRAALRIPCPLLDETGSCSVHAVRPLHCAGWTSLDLAACERHWQAPSEAPSAPVHAVGYELTGAVMGGLVGACEDAGLDGSLLELCAALRIALERPNAGDRWLRGLPVFAIARDLEAGAFSAGATETDPEPPVS